MGGPDWGGVRRGVGSGREQVASASPARHHHWHQEEGETTVKKAWSVHLPACVNSHVP